jgi:hypothetical protein
VCALTSLSTKPARADTDACIAQYDHAVADRKKGMLIAARAAYAACAVESCPSEIRTECERGSASVADEIPTIVVAACRADGTDVSRGEVLVDGKRAPRALDGLPIEIDPGRHELELRLVDGTVKKVALVARANQKGRLIRVELGSPAPAPRRAPPPVEPDGNDSLLGPVLLGVGGVALVSFGVFAILGYSKQKELEDDCKPACAPDEISTMQRLYLIADISLAVSVLAIGSGVVIMVSSGPGDSAALAVGGRF